MRTKQRKDTKAELIKADQIIIFVVLFLFVSKNHYSLFLTWNDWFSSWQT